MATIIEEALRELLRDGIPRSSGSIATASRQAAEGLLEWISIDSNRDSLVIFTSEVVQALDRAFPEQRLSQAAREKMWGAYHCIRTSPTFACLWREFLQRAKIQVLPIFYQSLTDILFQRRIEFYFPISKHSDKGEAEDSVLTFEEENAIRYAAGYVLRAVRKKTTKPSKQQKDQLVETIDAIVGDNDVVGNDISSSWLSVVDRGGLLHISDDLYRVFVAMELEIRRHLRLEKASEMVSSVAGKLVTHLLVNEDVQFYWCIVCCEIPEEIAREVLKSIAELWTTIRGFSFAKSYMEIYKQTTTKSLQRSKALRKNLFRGQDH